MPRHGMKKSDLLRAAIRPTLPANTLTAVVHAIPGDDGCKGIVDHLAAKSRVLMRNGIPTTNEATATLLNATGDRFLSEVRYPYLSGWHAYVLGIPPRFITHTLMLLPGHTGLYEVLNLPDFQRLIDREQPTSFGIGGLEDYLPAVAGLTDWAHMPYAARPLIDFVEARFGVPVMYVGTGDKTVMDREGTF